MSISYRIAKNLWQQPWFKRHFGKALYKVLSKRGPAPDTPFVTDFFGLSYAGNLRNNIEFSIYYYGAFEKPLLFFLRDCLHALQREQSVFFDIGANIGQHALFMSRLASRVHAFEPYEPVRKRLLEHIELNAISNIVVHPVGLGEREETLPFFAPTGSNQGIGSFDASSVNKGNRNIGELALFPGDEYLLARGIAKVDIVKIDVEGFEKATLKGLTQTLNNNRPVVVCEISYGGKLAFQNLAELQASLPRDYRFFTFDTRKSDGSKARRRGAQARSTGDYQLRPFDFEFAVGQDDIVACPVELLARLPMKNS